MITVLINAYACSPNTGSEPGMAWNWCINLAKHCKLHIITEGEFRDKIESVLPTLPQSENISLYYNPVSAEVRKMCWDQGDWRFYYYYAKWQKKTLKIAQQIIENNHIDLVHQLNMIGFREPGYLWKIDKPFIWGPIGGIGHIPNAYFQGADFKTQCFFNLKNQISNLQLQYAPRVRKAMKRATTVIVATTQGYQQVKGLCSGNLLLINESGCDPNIQKRQTDKQSDEFNIIWVGRFIYTKQLELALETIAKIKHLPGLKFHILGSAFNKEENVQYTQKAAELKIENICIWHGLVPNNEVQDLMSKCNLFFFTSIFEGTPHVILEAIKNHLPILCFNACGQGDIVNETIGEKIEFSTPRQSIIEFSEKIEYLYYHPDILSEKSKACICRQKELTWENKALEMFRIYQTTLA